LTLPPPPRRRATWTVNRPRSSGYRAVWHRYPRDIGVGFPLTVCHTHAALASKEERAVSHAHPIASEIRGRPLVPGAGCMICCGDSTCCVCDTRVSGGSACGWVRCALIRLTSTGIPSHARHAGGTHPANDLAMWLYHSRHSRLSSSPTRNGDRKPYERLSAGCPLGRARCVTVCIGVEWG
jgi:hypothetical protein